MVVFFSTVVRGAPIERGGEIIKLDWATKGVVARRAIVPDDPPINDPNPRGGTRGGRGILLRGREVLVASYHTIHVFDDGLQEEKRRIQNPLFANLHELAWCGDDLWVSSTQIDGAIRVNPFGETVDSWWPREDPVTARHLGLQPLPVDKQADNRLRFLEIQNYSPGHTHLNAVSMRDGRLFVFLNRHGAVVALQPTEIVLERASLHGAHNLLFTRSGHLAISNSQARSIDVFEPSWRPTAQVALGKFAPIRRILLRTLRDRIRTWLASNGRPRRLFSNLASGSALARPIFVRGLTETPTGTLLVGISPAAILEIDWRSSTLVDAFWYSDDVRAAVHGLVAVP